MSVPPGQRPTLWRAVAGLAAPAALAVCLAFTTSHAQAVTPESPQVKAAIEKGLKYLGSHAAEDDRVGAHALAAMAFAKNDAPLNHPQILRAVSKIRSALANREGDFNGSEQIYHLGLSLIFLASTDGKAYRNEIDELLKRLLAAQKPHGGWGYPAQETGDTSMTQYGVLGLWEAYKAGANPPLQSWERVANWLIRTQDPAGGFGYQGVDPGPGNFKLVQQSEVRPSMAAAGLGSLYVCLDHFDFDGSANATSQEQQPKLPSALKLVKPKEVVRAKQRPTSVDPARIRNATALGNRWFDKNFTPAPDEWRYYFVYAYERYRSFREQAENNSPEEPKWYTDIANSLIKSQEKDGSWAEQPGPVPDTAFCVLFLSRSTKISIQKALGAGTLVGGRGLPADTSNVTMRLGNVMRKPLSGPADQLLSVMENSNDPNFMAAVEGFAQQALAPDEAQLPELVVRLRKLAGGDSPAARIAALRALARTRDLDHVPLLIHALRDPDWGVVKEARDGLRFISRKFDSIGPEIPDEDSDPDQIEAERRKAIQAWREWYRSIRPEYVFEDS